MRSPAWVDPRNGMRWDNIVPTGARVVAAYSEGFEPIFEFQRPGYVKFEPTPPPDPPRAPFAGKKRDHR